MTPQRFRECLALLDWGIRSLATYLGHSSHTTVARWASGQGSIPHAVAEWLEALAAAHAARPYPQGWRLPSSAPLELELAWRRVAGGDDVKR